jgi:hypothetical protein
MTLSRRRRTCWKIFVRENEAARFKYVQTQRHHEPPEIGQLISIRSEGELVGSVILSIREIPRARHSIGGFDYAVEVEPV